MPDGWQSVSLASLVKTGRSISYGIVQPGASTHDGVPIVRVGDVRSGRIETTNPLRVSASVEAQYARTRLMGGELLLTLVGTVGESAIVPAELAGWNVARAVAVVPVRDDVGSRWVRLGLQSPAVRHAIDSHLNTTVQATINLRDVANLPIPMPPRPLREGITNVISAFDDKIELNRRMSETLEAMARALFRSWFVDFDPVRAKAQGMDTGLAEAVARSFTASFDESPSGMVPTGWRHAELGQVLTVLEAGRRPPGGVARYTSGVPSIGAESIVGLGFFDYSKTKYIPEEFYERMSSGHVQNRDVLVYKDGGRPGEFEPHVTLVGEQFPFARCAINEHVYRMRAKDSRGQSFLYFWMSSDPVMEAMRVRGTGVAIPSLNSSAARSLPALVPPPDVVHKFDEVVEPMVARVLTASLQSRSLGQLRDTLLPKLLSGELRVPDAERLAVEAGA